MKKILNITKPSYNKLILPVSWHFGMSRFHRTCTRVSTSVVLLVQYLLTDAKSIFIM